MQNRAFQIQHIAENFLKSKANRKIIDLGGGFKIYYIKALVDTDFVSTMQQLYYTSSINFDAYFRSIATAISDSEDDFSITLGLTKGDIVAIYKNQAWKITGVAKKENRGVPDIEREASFEGGAEGFNEETLTNINLVSQYYHQPDLIVNSFTVGTRSNVNLALLYDSSLADKNLLAELSNRIQKINVPVVQSLNGLQQFLWKKQLLIPRMLVTQRPDRVTQYLSEGKFAMFLDGTATALIFPVNFHDFFRTVDDEYLLPVPALFLLILRYTALILSIMLPSAYVAITSYNPEVLRVQLALSISSSRSGVPYPSFIEVLIMLVLMEFLTEASLRLPKTIGQTATTVGGLILGQAAIQAHLVSNIMIIIVSTVAISNFMIPVTSMNLTVRVIKYGLLIWVSFTGIYGIYLGLYGITCYLFSIYTFNIPYFDPIGSFSLKGAKSFFRKGQ